MKQERTIIQMLTATLCSLILAAGLFALPANAAETAVIPVEVCFTPGENKPVFTVELLPDTGENPMPEETDDRRFLMEVKANTEKPIRIPCEKEGMFSYTLRQLPGTDPLVRYDDRSYVLTVNAARSASGKWMVSTMLEDGGGENPDRALFSNAYLGPTSVTLTAAKILDGENPQDGAFRFLLLDESGDPVFETENRGGAVVFPALRFDMPGTYRYYLKEIAGDETGIVYDRAVYTAVVKVTGNDFLAAEVSWERNGAAYAGIPEFRNYTEGSSPKTGDGIRLYAAALILSGSVLTAAAVYARSRGKRSF